MSTQPAGESSGSKERRVPDALTVPEAGHVLRLGRSAAYEQANRWIETDGAEGIPAKRIGRSIRVPRLMLEEYLGGQITWPPPADVVEISDGQALIANAESPTSRTAPRRERRREERRRRQADEPQSELPFTA